MAERDSKSERCDKSGCGDTYQLIRDLNMVLVGIVASYFLEVMRSSGGAVPLHVLEGPGGPHFLSALGTSVTIVGSVVLFRDSGKSTSTCFAAANPASCRWRSYTRSLRCSSRWPPSNRGEPTSRGWPVRVWPRSHAQGALRHDSIRISGLTDRRAEAPPEVVVQAAFGRCRRMSNPGARRRAVDLTK